ncbi:papain-like cysteine protease family protein [Actinophytocola sp.]|uniref:papain-like cysteine protease family protein n=1 Tax=Actinophytocola sp. TaxID=1872138 RepID=UPI002D7FBB9C|nr:papain-like cysteine protease family protein [Actinophytocola sp.]HET9141330.1 papain-like cysteine protease family protein [Actinophytocola sp.]
MADEATSGTTTADPGTESAPTQTTGTQAGGGGSGAGTGPLPELEPGSTNTQWVTFLQQMLNYYYQMQVCAEDGHFGGQTAGVVERFRKEKKLPAGDSVDTAVWGKLGLQDSPAQSGGQGQSGQHGQGQQGGGSQDADFDPVDWQVTMEAAGSNETCWAAALAMVLRYRGDNYTVEDLCQRGNVSATDWTPASRALEIGAGLSMRSMTCQAGVAASLAADLKAHGPLWTPVPGDEYHIVVLTGITPYEGNPHVHVLDPLGGNDVWLSMADLASGYGIGESFSGEVLAGT